MKDFFLHVWNAIPWASVYQKITHYAWLFLTTLAVVLGAVFCNTSNQIEVFVIAVCITAQVGAVGQELIRWAMKKDGFDAVNYLCTLVRFIEAGFLGAMIWFMIRNA